MIYVFLADGFEEIEALAPVDFLRRAGIDVKTVGVSGKFCRGAHGINVEADILPEEVDLDKNLQGIVLPGGMPGTENLFNSRYVENAVDYSIEENKIIGAICAAPIILGRRGLLRGRRVTCYPGFEEELYGATITHTDVAVDDKLVTARGAGVAWDFAVEICDLVLGQEESLPILRGIQWRG